MSAIYWKGGTCRGSPATEGLWGRPAAERTQDSIEHQVEFPPHVFRQNTKDEVVVLLKQLVGGIVENSVRRRQEPARRGRGPEHAIGVAVLLQVRGQLLKRGLELSVHRRERARHKAMSPHRVCACRKSGGCSASGAAVARLIAI